jgi:hypothetical protein
LYNFGQGAWSKHNLFLKKVQVGVAKQSTRALVQVGVAKQSTRALVQLGASCQAKYACPRASGSCQAKYTCPRASGSCQSKYTCPPNTWQGYTGLCTLLLIREILLIWKAQFSLNGRLCYILYRYSNTERAVD